MGLAEEDHRHALDSAIVAPEMAPWPGDLGDSPDASKDRKSCKE
jgi:hypothetical protein